MACCLCTGPHFAFANRHSASLLPSKITFCIPLPCTRPPLRLHCKKSTTKHKSTRIRCSALVSCMANSGAVRIHYHRKNGSYEKWGLHVWGDADVSTSWENPLPPCGTDDYGLFWDVNMQSGGTVHFIVHQGDIKDGSGSVSSSSTKELWIISENDEIFTEKPDVTSVRKGNLRLARAYWVNQDLIAWPSDIEGCEFSLHASKSANLSLSVCGIEGTDVVIELGKNPEGLPTKVVEKFPHIMDYVSMKIPSGSDAKELLKCQLALAVKNEDGILINATGIQISGVLDDIFAYNGPLGVLYMRDCIELFLWAPTAQMVKLLLFTCPSGGEPDMTVDLHEENGVWVAHGPRKWIGHYYIYEITVFHPFTQKIEMSMANDPYSRGLSANGERSLLVDLDSPETQPTGWKDLAQEKPKLEYFTDIAIYELHIRDFSISDASVDPHLQGTYLAFTMQDSQGIKHLKSLVDAGLTHVHLLPSYDFGSVDEIKENWKYVDTKKLAMFPPDSEEQQVAVVAIKDEDGYNWGYDPVNWGVPEGSYATDPNGSKRIIEFRQMVQALNRLGLRVVLDVVYNHMYGSGPHGQYSVLDKVVPGYYLRRNAKGEIENSACMNNTASEHYMVDRLIVDDLRHWAVNYKVDGFRFDLMGHLMKRTMVRAREVVRNLTVDNDGTNGSKIFFYGEGWDFGEVACNARGENATQGNLSGTGIGSFNDRIRDRVIGGSPFSDPRIQGFVTGLHLRPNDLDQGGVAVTRNDLAASTDWIHVALAGNLTEFSFSSYLGEEVKGKDITTHDNKPVAYAASPEETINYVSAHDNETLFDIIMLKSARDVSLEDRCRINSLASSMVALAQGIPFFHAGDDMLRSKSLDRDSYNSGDWFNRLDFTYESNNWGVGLPPKEKNENKWSIMRNLLADEGLHPRKEHILLARDNFEVFLKIRFSSPLFHLSTATEIQERIKFHNTGPTAILGVIVMSIEDGGGESQLQQLDTMFKSIIVIFNARPSSISINVPSCQEKVYVLHPLQANSLDNMIKHASFEDDGNFTVPQRSTAVFVEYRAQ